MYTTSFKDPMYMSFNQKTAKVDDYSSKHEDCWPLES